MDENAKHPLLGGDPFGVMARRETGGAFVLKQWPVKLRGISVNAPYFHRTHLVILSDCAAFCYIQMHDHLTAGRIPLLCCPETDVEIIDKLAKILAINDVLSVSVAQMDTGCCDELTSMVQTAVRKSRKPLPVQSVSVFVDAEEID